MIHLCFVIDNSLTMEQRPHNGMTLLDCVKSSVENTLRSLNRLGFPNAHEHVHLFCSSAPRTYLSGFEHDEAHLYCQLKAIAPAIDTDPALALQTAIDHISRFRILSEAETLKGYRQAFIYEPALIVFISDRMTKRKMQKLTACLQGKAFMRSQYQLATYLVGFPSYTERGLLTEEGFRGKLQGQRDIRLYGEALRRINSQLKFVMSYEGLTASLWNRIQTFKPSLLFNFELKDLKRKYTDFIPSERGAAYFKAWQQFLNNIPFQLVPTKLWKIPLPYATKCSEQGQRRLEGLGSFRFYLDLTKKYVESNSTILPENKYKILPNPAVAMLENDSIDQKFPIFFEHKGVECPVGLLCLSPRGTEASFYFGNFTVLNSILKSLQAKMPMKAIEAATYQYLLTLPHFYIKFLRTIFDKLNLVIDYDLFENPLANSSALALQTQLESLRMMEKRNLPKLFQANLQNHQKFKADCCPTYSSVYTGGQGQLDNVGGYFSELVGELLAFKKKAGVEDYLSSNQIDPVPMVKELEKYNTLKKIGEDDFNQNITINFGNPYRKKRKANETEPKEAIIIQDTAENTQKNQKLSQKVAAVLVEKAHFEKEVVSEAKDQAKSQSESSAMIPQEQKKHRRIIKATSPAAGETSLKKNSQRMIEEKVVQPIVVITDETVRRINGLPLNKEIQVKFNPMNLATPSLTKNQEILRRFMQKWRKN